MTARTSRRLLPAILFLGLLLRLWIAAHVVVIAADGIVRIGLARAFAERGWAAGLTACLDHAYHPLNPILIWIVGEALGDFERAGFAVSILFGTLGIAGIYLLARDVWGEREGLLAALLWAVLPNAVHFSADVLTEGQFLAFWIFGAWAGLRTLKDGGIGWALVCGLLGGLAYLTRVEGLGVPLATGLFLLLKARARHAAILAAGVLILASPYLLHLHQARGDWRVSPQKSVANLITRASTVWEDHPAQKPDLPKIPASWPAKMLTAVKYADPIQTGVKTFTPWVLALALVGLWRVRPRPGGSGYLLGLAGLHGLAVLRLFQTAGYASHRHFMPPLVVVVAWSAAGLTWALACLNRTSGKQAGCALVGILCALLMAQTCLDRDEQGRLTLRCLRNDKGYRRDFGVWLGQHTPPDAWLASLDKPEIAYYANRVDIDCSVSLPLYLDDFATWLDSSAPKDPIGRPLVLKTRGVSAVPQILVLEREEDAEAVALVKAHPFWTSWTLSNPFDIHFAVFQQKVAYHRASP